MPYNPGTGVYSLPAIYLAIPATTILAAQHNTPLEDLEVANNYARPIIAGGTGANTAILARASLGANGNLKTFQDIVATGTWTKPAGCVAIVVEGTGGGGAGGGVDGQGAGTTGAGGGGSSGAFGTTGLIDVTGIASGAVVIGAAGAPGAAGNVVGGNGGLTSITLGGTTYIWSGGTGGGGSLASTTTFSIGSGSGIQAGSANLFVSGNFGEDGYSGSGSLVANGGNGGSSPYTQGGTGAFILTSGQSGGGAPGGGGKGGGGGGGAAVAVATNVVGGAGAIGFIRVWEFY